MTLRPHLFAVAIVLATLAPLSAQDRLTPELLWKLGRVSDVQASPDGKALLYQVRRYDLAANSGETQVWRLDLSTMQHKQLTTVGSNFGARWSPDGKQIAFLSTRSGSAQIHVLDVSGGEARQVTEHQGGVSNLQWSPDGKWFSFTASVKLDRDVHDMFPDLPKADARIYDDLMIRHWDQWEDGSYSHLFVVPVGGGIARDLMPALRASTPLPPFGGVEQIAWAPDSKHLCYVAKIVDDPESSTNSDVYMVPVAGGDAVDLTDGMPGYEIDPSFAPDGKTVAFSSMATAGYESDQNRLFVVDLASHERRQITDWDLTVGTFAWLPDGSGFLLTADTEGTRQVFRVPFSGGKPEAVTEGRWHFDDVVPAPDGSAFYALRMQTERPFEVVRVALGGEPDEGKALTDVNGAIFAKLALPKVEARWFDATDGKKIHSWIIYPPDFDPSKKWPMLLYCQGGPQSQVGQWFSFRWNFHLMAADGYVVLAVNRRGLPGFGTAWNAEISKDWGGQPMQDLLSATDAMQKEPFIDRKHTAAVGASFGGYTIYWLMGHDQPDRFCAMVAHDGVFNLESMYLSTEELWFPNWDIGGPYWASPAIQKDYQRFSPHEYVQNWDTPLLVIHGQKDFRVPFEQGLQAFTAAQLRGLPSRLLYFPEECHWVLGAQNGVLWHRVFFDWLDRFCK